MKFYYVFLLFTITCLCYSQSMYKGRIVIPNEVLHQVNVKNVSKKIETETDTYGYFFIKAIKGDTIVFKSEFIHTKTLIVTDSLLARLRPVYLASISTELKEIVIDDYDANFLKVAQAQQKISAEIPFDPNMNILGLIKKGISLFKKKKPEKKISNDDLNKIKKVNRYVIDWTKNQRLADLPEAFYTEKLELPKHLIDQFVYFVSQSPQFSSWMNTEDEDVLLSKLLEQKKWFLEYYNQR